MKKNLFLVFIFLNSCIYAESSERIISLGPAKTEELYLLGAGDKVVGVTTYCIRPEDAKKKQHIGTVTQIDMEKIIALRPSIVIATPLLDKRQLEKLKGLGINVISFPLAKSFSDICKQFLELGRIVGEEKRAEKIILEAQARVSKLGETVKNIPKTSVFIQIGARPLYTMAKDSFINDYIELAGGINIAGERNSRLFSREEVLKKDPDIILIVTMGIAGEREKKIWERFKQLKAVRNNRFYILDSYKMCSPTPVSFVEMLEEMVNILHRHD